MKVMVLGNGAREHALLWKYSRSNRISGLYAVPGNAGTSDIATNVTGVDIADGQAVVTVATDYKVDAVFIGPEVPLVHGVVDALHEAGIPAIGPNAEAARLEGSKEYSKSFMQKHGIPTAAHHSFTDPSAFEHHVRNSDVRLVVKKSGLAAGKGVTESKDVDSLVAFGKNVLAAGDSVVTEEYLSGYEVSLFGLSDGNTFQVLPPCTDYKKAGVGGTGPNTGGMGAISPVPWLPPTAVDQIMQEIVEPTYTALQEGHLLFAGILYFGIIVTEAGPRLLEYNVRFGDPEAQVVLPLIQTDFADLTEAIINRSIGQLTLSISEQSSLGVVVAAPGYPSSHPTDLSVDPLPHIESEEAFIFHASTTRGPDGIRTGGGRCFTVVGLGHELLEARANAYRTAKNVTFPGSWMRPDIGGRIFG